MRTTMQTTTDHPVSQRSMVELCALAGSPAGLPANVTRAPGAAPSGGCTNLTTVWSALLAHSTMPAAEEGFASWMVQAACMIAWCAVVRLGVCVQYKGRGAEYALSTRTCGTLQLNNE